MVRVWYEPPPGGPRTHLNRGSYYVESATTPMFMRKLQRMNPTVAIGAGVTAIAALCYIPLSTYRTYAKAVPFAPIAGFFLSLHATRFDVYVGKNN